jgi:hypothetical protein
MYQVSHATKKNTILEMIPVRGWPQRARSGPAICSSCFYEYTSLQPKKEISRIACLFELLTHLPPNGLAAPGSKGCLKLRVEKRI